MVDLAGGEVQRDKGEKQQTPLSRAIHCLAITITVPAYLQILREETGKALKTSKPKSSRPRSRTVLPRPGKREVCNYVHLYCICYESRGRVATILSVRNAISDNIADKLFREKQHCRRRNLRFRRTLVSGRNVPTEPTGGIWIYPRIC